MTDVIDAIKTDPTLRAVQNMILTGQWHHTEEKYASGSEPNIDIHALQAYRRISSELSITQDGLILRGNRITVPASLQEHVVQLAHEGHQGINKPKSLLREKVWFPGIDNMVTQMVKGCIPCKSTYDAKPREPIQMTELPSRPWSHVSADFYGPLPSGHYILVVIDEYSRLPEVEIVKSQSAATVIPVFDKIFSARGVPDCLKTDNGTPFQSEDFKLFARFLGFEHRKNWPEANSLAERFMRSLGKTCRCAQITQKP